MIALDRDMVAELERALEAREAVRAWRELRTNVLDQGGIRPGPDHPAESIPTPLRRRHGTPPDELAQVLRLFGELLVEDGEELVRVAQQVYARYVEVRDVDVDPWHRCVLEALGELQRRGQPWTAEELRLLVGAPTHPNALGATVRALFGRGVIRPVGVTNATRREARGRLVRRWEVAIQ